MILLTSAGHGNPLNGLDCMAVINRDDMAQPVDTAVTDETAKFGSHLQGLNFSPADAAMILDRCGIEKLVARLHTKFLGFVKREWKDNTMSGIMDRVQAAEEELRALGTPSGNLDADQVMQHAACQVPI